MKESLRMVFVMTIMCIFLTASSVTAQNLLTNPGAETGSMSGWTVLLNGGNGWGIWGVDTISYEGPRSGNNCFLTSYDWDTRSQLVDLLSLGYNAGSLDTAPVIYAEEWFGQANPYDVGQFYLRVELRDENQNIIASYDSGIQQTAWNGSGPASWSSLSYTFSGYGPGLRYIYWEDGGIDSNYWNGYYGAKMDDALLSMPPPDLVVSYLSGAAVAYNGGNITKVRVLCKIMNEGDGPAPASRAEFYLSRDTTVSGDDVYLGSVNIRGIAEGGEVAIPYWTTFTLPPGVSSSGTWYIIGVADADDAVSELSETNNVRAELLVFPRSVR